MLNWLAAAQEQQPDAVVPYGPYAVQPHSAPTNDPVLFNAEYAAHQLGYDISHMDGYHMDEFDIGDFDEEEEDEEEEDDEAYYGY